MSNETEDARTIRRLRNKLEKRDRRIDGLHRRIVELERKVAHQYMLPRDIQRAVQDALCNVRMIPVHGLSRNDRIVDVSVYEPKRKGEQ